MSNTVWKKTIFTNPLSNLLVKFVYFHPWQTDGEVKLWLKPAPCWWPPEHFLSLYLRMFKACPLLVKYRTPPLSLPANGVGCFPPALSPPPGQDPPPPRLDPNGCRPDQTFPLREFCWRFYPKRLEPFIHSFTHHRWSQPRRATASSSGAVKVRRLTQGHLDTRAGDRTQPTLPPELLPPVALIMLLSP